MSAAKRRFFVPLAAVLLAIIGIGSSAGTSARASTPAAGGTGNAATANGKAAAINNPAASPPLSLLTSVKVHGGYVSAGIGMRNLGHGTIALSGIPAGSTIDKAYLLWDVINSSSTTALAGGTFNGQAVTGNLVGTGGTPCWPSFGATGYANYSYEADVTSLVTGNGSYQLTGFASGSTAGEDPWNSDSPFPELEGASLVAIYDNAASPSTTVQIYGGAAETDSGNTLTQTLSGFTAGSSPQAHTTFIVADGQSLPDGGGSFDGSALVSTFAGSDPQAASSYSQGSLWDTDTFDVSSLIKGGDASETATVQGTSDCLVWVGQVFSVTSSAHYELNVKLWIPQKAVVDPANSLGTMPYLEWHALVLAGLLPDLSNPSPAIGPFEPGGTCQDPATGIDAALTTVSSTLDGDGYSGYDDGSTFRAAAKISFDWDGSAISNVVFTPMVGISHRAIVERTRTLHGTITRTCVEYHPGTATGSATTQSPSTLAIKTSGVVGFLTGQARALGAYPSNSWDVTVNPDGSLGISYKSTEFPTTGLQVLLNGQVRGTDIVNDASCYSQQSLLGFFAPGLFLKLFHFTTHGTLPAVTPDGPPTNVDLRSPGC